MRTITKESFLQAKDTAPLMQVLTESIRYKNAIQTSIIPMLTNQELEDVKNSRINLDVINKFCQLGAWQPNVTSNTTSLYACAMAIATIIKEYGWGTDYLTPDGLYNLVTSILDKAPINP